MEEKISTIKSENTDALDNQAQTIKTTVTTSLNVNQKNENLATYSGNTECHHEESHKNGKHKRKAGPTNLVTINNGKKLKAILGNEQSYTQYQPSYNTTVAPYMCQTINLNQEHVTPNVLSDGAVYNDYIIQPCPEDRVPNDDTCTQTKCCLETSVNPYMCTPMTVNQQGGIPVYVNSGYVYNGCCTQACTQTEDITHGDQQPHTSYAPTVFDTASTTTIKFNKNDVTMDEENIRSINFKRNGETFKNTQLSTRKLPNTKGKQKQADEIITRNDKSKIQGKKKHSTKYISSIDVTSTPYKRKGKKRQAGQQTSTDAQKSLQPKKKCRIESMNSQQELPYNEGVSQLYIDLGDCCWRCEYCDATFWYGERLKGTTNNTIKYKRCCGAGQVYLKGELDPPYYVKELFKDKHFLENIRAYNQMFSMTSFGAKIDDSVNDGRGPYVFKISGQIYHWIGTLCPENNEDPKFLQLYIYDTQNEVANRMKPFGGQDKSNLSAQVVQDLIQILDKHNELVRIFRTARDKCNEADVPELKIQLYNVVGAQQYDLPSTGTLGAIVFEDGPSSRTEYDVIIEYRNRGPQRINKLHSSYMSLQFPLLFIYGQPGYNTKMTLQGVNSKKKRKK